MMVQGRIDRVRDPVMAGDLHRFETFGWRDELVRRRKMIRGQKMGGDGKEIELGGAGAVGE